MGRNWKPKYAQVCMSCDWTGKNTRTSVGACPQCRAKTVPLRDLRHDLAAARARIAELEARLASLTSVSEEDVERVKRALAGLSTPMMGGDNLAIVLCSCFENPDQKPDGDHVWTPDAVAGYEEVIDAAVRAALTAFVRK